MGQRASGMWKKATLAAWKGNLCVPKCSKRVHLEVAAGGGALQVCRRAHIAGAETAFAARHKTGRSSFGPCAKKARKGPMLWCIVLRLFIWGEEFQCHCPAQQVLPGRMMDDGLRHVERANQTVAAVFRFGTPGN